MHTACYPWGTSVQYVLFQNSLVYAGIVLWKTKYSLAKSKYKIKNTQNTRYLLSVTVTHASPIPKLLTLPGEERPLLVIGR